MILALHNRYRTLGGEERAVEDLTWLAREHLGEEVELLVRDSSLLGRRAAATGLLRGGLDPDEVTAAIRRTRADIVHAHNLLPSFGWRALAAARAAGAKTVLHLHNYRLVCAVATCVDPAGEDCTRCHGRNTTPGLRLGCRGSAVEGVAYAAALSVWQRRTLDLADVVVVPSAAAKERLLALGVPVGDALVVPHVVRTAATTTAYAADGPALVVARLAPEKGVDVAIAACREARVGLVIAGDGPEAADLRRVAAAAGLTVLEGNGGPAPWDGQVRFAGRVPDELLSRLRAAASVELIPSRAHETFGLAAIEALAFGLPIVASGVGALAALPEPVRLVPPGDAGALALAVTGARGDARAAAAGPQLARSLAGPEVVAPALAAAYAGVRGGRGQTS
ncbi:glycosyltransferase [Paraconexibacter antarcticus]|uniref:Glycosyltransferase n=1 Tax=Paraconexibacter antarcticus TaxID=2949664 RepID=A0ABY5DWV6_9ACTN|nr:glycosyltransferase [Paraconexibacter antarcticus]UTI65034.1 glycosyltransferase [Paraconexibacter antarcticus]